MTALAHTDLERPTVDPLRRRQIIRLLETRDQHLPEPRRRLRVATGFVHQTLAPTVCDVCEGVDSTACTGCGGRGYVERMRDRDPYANNLVMPYGWTPSRIEAARDRDQQIDRLQEQLRPPRSAADLLAEANERPDPWERDRARMYRRHHYAALDRALDHLAVRCPTAVTVLHQVYVYAWLTDASGSMRRVAELGLTFIDARFWLWGIDPIRAPGSEPQPTLAAGRVARCAGDAALDERDREIRRAVLEARIPTVSVAATWGLSISQVNRIIAKGDMA